MWYFSRPLKGISVIQLTITDFASFSIMQSEEYHIIGLKSPCTNLHRVLKLKILDEIPKSLW